MSETELIRQPEASGELTIPQLAAQMDKLREVMRSVMKADSDYGIVPGTKSKPTLLKPGGENIVTWNGKSYSASRMCYSDGHIYKLLSDVPTTNGTSRSRTCPSVSRCEARTLSSRRVNH